jgi:hypothetical protein
MAMIAITTSSSISVKANVFGRRMAPKARIEHARVKGRFAAQPNLTAMTLLSRPALPRFWS